mmetsp:Transcript_27378/g.38072  ORF Transcript_27378/g.38072 Transcript_27378/m.38072 type:complete len:128 (-) Transcript_27378:11-394(-)
MFCIFCVCVCFRNSPQRDAKTAAALRISQEEKKEDEQIPMDLVERDQEMSGEEFIHEGCNFIVFAMQSRMWRGNSSPRKRTQMCCSLRLFKLIFNGHFRRRGEGELADCVAEFKPKTEDDNVMGCHW